MKVNENKLWRHPIKAVGVIGLGGLGSNICRRLAREQQQAGLSRIIGFDTEASAMESLKPIDVTPAKSIAHLVEVADLLLLCLPKASDVGKIARSHEGLLDCMRQGQIIVDHSCSPADLATQLATAFSSRGAAFLDAPIIRSNTLDHDIDKGSLALTISGEEAAIDAAIKPLHCFAGDIKHVGPIGAAQVLRQLSDLVALQTFTALAEALVTARAYGIEIDSLDDTLPNSRGSLSGIGQESLAEFLGKIDATDQDCPSILDADRRLKEALHLAEQKKLTLAGADGTQAWLKKAVEKGIGEQPFVDLLSIIQPQQPRRRVV